VIEVGVLTWTSVWLSYVEPAVTLRMKDLESISSELEGERGGVWGGMSRRGTEGSLEMVACRAGCLV